MACGKSAGEAVSTGAGSGRTGAGSISTVSPAASWAPHCGQRLACVGSVTPQLGHTTMGPFPAMTAAFPLMGAPMHSQTGWSRVETGGRALPACNRRTSAAEVRDHPKRYATQHVYEVQRLLRRHVDRDPHCRAAPTGFSGRKTLRVI